MKTIRKRTRTSATAPASAASVVTVISLGADASKTITCTFGANASAGVLASTAKVVTPKLTNQELQGSQLPPRTSGGQCGSWGPSLILIRHHIKHVGEFECPNPLQSIAAAPLLSMCDCEE